MAIAQAYYLERASDFTTSLADSPQGILSFWIKPSSVTPYDDAIPGNIGSNIVIFPSIVTGRGNTLEYDDLRTGVSNGECVLTVGGSGSTPNGIMFVGAALGTDNVPLSLISNTALVFDSWNHILASWDVSAGTASLYINDVDQLNLGFSNLPAGETIAWATLSTLDFLIAWQLDGCLEYLYLNTLEYLDFSVTANRRKFITAGLAPASLGAFGETPTGTAPTIYMTMYKADIPLNQSMNGDFATVYDPSISVLSNCSTDP